MKAPLLLALAGLSISTAQAAEGVLTLTCQGRTITKIGTGPSKEEPMSMGVIVNFTARTVTGFRPRSDDIPVEINAVNEKAVEFGGYNKSGDIVAGSIDRVTGDLEAISASGSWTTSYSLQCEPKQRMF
jgi:hypothetical protein